MDGKATDSKSVNAAVPATKSRSCNDIIFALLFVAIVVATVYFASAYGTAYMDATQLHDVQNATGFSVVIRYGATAGGVAIAISLAWIVTMMFMGEFIIWFSIGFMIAANIFAAWYMTKHLYERQEDYYWWPAALFGTAALLILLFAVCIRHRVKFAAVHLRVAGSAILRLPMTLVLALLMVGFQLAWAMTCVVGAFGLLHHQNIINRTVSCSNQATMDKCEVTFKYGPAFGMLFVILLVFFWGAMVLKNILAVTVSGTVAAWKVNAAVPMITMVAWGRAMSFSFGSICFGSLIVAILETIQTMLTLIAAIAKKSGNCVAACLIGCTACIVGCIKSWMETFNRFAYAYIGIHGYSFIKAGHEVSKMLNARGWTAIVNDDLTQKVFFLGNLVVGSLACFITIQIANADLKGDAKAFAHMKNPEATVGAIAFLIGYVVNNLFMSLMGGAVSTIFVLWAEDPAGWQATQPHFYDKLHSAWSTIYPDEYNNGAGKPAQAESSV